MCHPVIIKSLIIPSNADLNALISHQGIIPAFAGTGSAALPSIAPPPPPAFAGAGFAGAGLRRIALYASVVSPRRPRKRDFAQLN
jgi:hypothetical protein